VSSLFTRRVVLALWLSLRVRYSAHLLELRPWLQPQGLSVSRASSTVSAQHKIPPLHTYCLFKSRQSYDTHLLGNTHCSESWIPSNIWRGHIDMSRMCHRTALQGVPASVRACSRAPSPRTAAPPRCSSSPASAQACDPPPDAKPSSIDRRRVLAAPLTLVLAAVYTPPQVIHRFPSWGPSVWGEVGGGTA